MNWQYFFSAIGLVLIFEGMLPFISPSLWKRMILLIMEQDNKSLRISGFVMMILGTLLIYLVNSVILGE